MKRWKSGLIMFALGGLIPVACRLVHPLVDWRFWTLVVLVAIYARVCEHEVLQAESIKEAEREDKIFLQGYEAGILAQRGPEGRR